MSLKLIKDRIFPNCIGKTDHKVFENNSYFYDVIGNRYVVFFVNENNENVEVASYEDRDEMFSFFKL